MNIIADSSYEKNEETEQRVKVKTIPFHIEVNGNHYCDDGQISIPNLLSDIKASPKIAKTACPSPKDFMEAMEAGLENIIITISSKLSGSYSAAELAKRLFQEQHGEETKVHVVDSKSAVGGETLIALKIAELKKMGESFEEIKVHIQKYVEGLRTFFVLEDLETLSKSGRLNKVVGKIAAMISLRPIMTAADGEIKMLKKVRGTKKALEQLVRIVAEDSVNFGERMLTIAHCNCYERAEELLNQILAVCPFKAGFIFEAGGLNTTYQNDGGIVLSY